MANLKVRWVLPTTRENGRPITPADISHVRIEVSADSGTNYGMIGDFLPDQLETIVQDLDFGTYVFRGLVADKQGRVSAPTFGTFVNEPGEDSPPGALRELVLELV